MPHEPIRVLSLNPDPGICALRHKVLTKAGFVVSSPSTARQVLAEIGQHQFDVLALGHRWPGVAMQELAEEFKRRNPTGCVVGITALRDRATPHGRHHGIRCRWSGHFD